VRRRTRSVLPSLSCSCSCSFSVASTNAVAASRQSAGILSRFHSSDGICPRSHEARLQRNVSRSRNAGSGARYQGSTIPSWPRFPAAGASRHRDVPDPARPDLRLLHLHRMAGTAMRTMEMPWMRQRHHAGVDAGYSATCTREQGTSVLPHTRNASATMICPSANDFSPPLVHGMPITADESGTPSSNSSAKVPMLGHQFPSLRERLLLRRLLADNARSGFPFFHQLPASRADLGDDFILRFRINLLPLPPSAPRLRGCDRRAVADRRQTRARGHRASGGFHRGWCSSSWRQIALK
jgi:hypothetical protein